VAVDPDPVLGWLSRSGESPDSGDDQSQAWRRAWIRPIAHVKRNDMTLDNEQIVRKAYQIAEEPEGGLP